MNELNQLLANNGETGIFVILFVSLLTYTINRNAKREEKYQVTIEKNQEVISRLSVEVLEKMKDIISDLNILKNRK